MIGRLFAHEQIPILPSPVQPQQEPMTAAPGLCGSTGYVAIDGLSRLLSSPDFLTWTVRAAPFLAGSAEPGAVAWGANTFVAVGNVSSSQSRVSLSADGVSWTDGPLVPLINARVIWDGSQFIMTSRSNLGRPPLARSSDGRSWTTYAFPPGIASCAATGAGVTVIGLIAGFDGSAESVWTTSDWSSWTYRSNPFDYDVLSRHATNVGVWDVAWNGSMFVAVGIAEWAGFSEPSRTIMTSRNGISWTGRTSAFDEPVPVGARGLARGVAWNGSIWAVVGSGPEPPSPGHPEIGGPFICTSPDGVTWTRRVLANLTVDPVGPSWDQGWDVDAVAGSIIAGGDPRTSSDPPFAYSADGINWTVPDISYTPERGPFLSVAIGGGGSCASGELAVAGVQDARLFPRSGQ